MGGEEPSREVRLFSYLTVADRLWLFIFFNIGEGAARARVRSEKVELNTVSGTFYLLILASVVRTAILKNIMTGSERGEAVGLRGFGFGVKKKIQGHTCRCGFVCYFKEYTTVSIRRLSQVEIFLKINLVDWRKFRIFA